MGEKEGKRREGGGERKNERYQACLLSLDSTIITCDVVAMLIVMNKPQQPLFALHVRTGDDDADGAADTHDDMMN